MRLLLVELSRFRSRRAIALMLVGAALLTVLIAVTTAWDTRPVSEADRAAAQAQADAEAERPHVAREIARCEQNPRRYLGPRAEAGECAAAMTPQADWFLFRAELSLAEENRDSAMAVLVISAAVMIIIGTTFAGADWASGSMSNQLLFEPRRARVWLAKAGAVFVGTMAATALFITAFWAFLFVLAEARGIATGATVQETIRWTAARGVLLAGAGAVGGYALTMLLRHTVGTLAAMFVYAVGGEMLIASVPVEGMGRWSLANNMFAWLQDGYEYYDSSLPCEPGRNFCDQLGTLTLGSAAAYIAVLLAAVMVLSLVLFRRRDIP